MKKYYTKEGKEVKVGDKVCLRCKKVLGNREFTHSITTVLTKSTINCLVESGYLTEKELSDSVTETVNKNKEQMMQEVYDKIYNKISHNIGSENIKLLEKHYPKELFCMMLHELALMMDESYPKHIKDCKIVYVINLSNGKINRIKQNNIKFFKNVSLFRTLEDAILACKILKDIKKKVC